MFRVTCESKHCRSTQQQTSHWNQQLGLANTAEFFSFTVNSFWAIVKSSIRQPKAHLRQKLLVLHNILLRHNQWVCQSFWSFIHSHMLPREHVWQLFAYLFLALDVEMRKYGFLRVTEIKSEKPSKNTNILCSRVCHNHLIASYE